MMDITRRSLGASLGSAVAIAAAGAARAETAPGAMSDSEWKRRLTPAQFAVLRRSGTERPYSSPLNGESRSGTFACVACGQPLFSSAAKYDSRTGWPSFWQALPGGTTTSADRSLGTVRTAVSCARCGGHQGHVFSDGPAPTGQRWCMNGVALRFQPGAA